MSSSTSKEQVAPAFCIKGAECEADENHGGSQEGCDDDAEGTQTVLVRAELSFKISQMQCLAFTEQVLADI